MYYSAEDIRGRKFQYRRTCLTWTSKHGSQPAVDLKEKQLKRQNFGLLKGFVQQEIIDEEAILRMSTISGACQIFKRIFYLSVIGDINQNLEKRINTTLWR